MNVEKKYGIRKINGIGLFVVFIIAIIGLVLTSTDLAFCIYKKVATPNTLAWFAANILTYVFVILYGAVGYKVKKMNLLKSIMLFFALTNLIIDFIDLFQNPTQPVMYVVITLGIAFLLIAYISGRLYKYTIVNILSTITLCVLIAASSMYIYFVYKNSGDPKSALAVIGYLSAINSVVAFGTLMACYLTTYHLYPETLRDKDTHKMILLEAYGGRNKTSTNKTTKRKVQSKKRR